MTMKEIQQKNDADLALFITEKQEELRKLHFGATGSGMRSSHSMRNLRHEIARGLTELNKRQKANA
jgi:ribosomal protein L29